MISKILSKSQCAECRICCSFDNYDLWETPIIDDETKRRSIEINPDVRFTESSGVRQYRMECEPDEPLYYCPMLDREKGCKLGDNKPFDCRIWPYRVMNFEGRRVIVVSSVCPAVFSKPLNEIKSLADELAPEIFAEADRNPGMVKPFISGYVILIAEKIKREI